jgi:hypothetical protein
MDKIECEGVGDNDGFFECGAAGLSIAERVVMVPYLQNRADAVDGHYCIARLREDGCYEFWSDGVKKWCSAGTVFELGKAV